MIKLDFFNGGGQLTPNGDEHAFLPSVEVTPTRLLVASTPIIFSLRHSTTHIQACEAFIRDDGGDDFRSLPVLW